MLPPLDDLKFSTNLTGIAGNNFLNLSGARFANSLTFTGSDAKYVWANGPSNDTGTARQLRIGGTSAIGGGIVVEPGSGPVYLGNAGVSGTVTVASYLALRVEAPAATYLNRSSSDLVIGTPYGGGVAYDPATGVGGALTSAQTGGRIGGGVSGTTSHTLTLDTEGSGNIVVNGLIDAGGTERTLSLVVKRSSGSGVVYFNNNVGPLTNGESTPFATVTIESGVVSLGNGIATSSTAASLSWPATINDGATLVVNRTAEAAPYAMDVSRTLSGGGTVEITGGSVVSVNSPQGYTGGTVVTNGTLQLADSPLDPTVFPGGSLASGVDVAAGSIFNVNRSLAQPYSFPHAITGAGQVTKDGTGSLTLTGTNTYTGPTSVNDGTLVVDGVNSGAGAVTINATGVLGGTGSIGGDVSFAQAGARFLVDVAGGTPLTVNGSTVDFFSGFGIANLIGIDSGTDLGLYPLFAGSADILTANLANLGPANALPLGDGKSAYFVNGSGLGVQVVPEPASLALTAMALAGLAVGAIRRRKAAVKKG